jgi:hypothetical protein
MLTPRQVVNLMSSDTHRMLMAVPIFHVLPCSVFKVGAVRGRWSHSDAQGCMYILPRCIF